MLFFECSADFGPSFPSRKCICCNKKILSAPLKSQYTHVYCEAIQIQTPLCKCLFFPKQNKCVCNISSPLTLCSTCSYIRVLLWLISLLIPPFCIIHRTFHIFVIMFVFVCIYGAEPLIQSFILIIHLLLKLRNKINCSMRTAVLWSCI